MSVAVVADAHLGGPGGDAPELIVQLRALPELGCERLLVLGDLFHVWIGHPTYETDEIRVLSEALRELRSDGLRIEYVEGNRDFFLADSIYSDCFDLVTDAVSFERDGTSYLAVHGDGLDASDRQYLFWRRLSKSRFSRFMMFHLPAWVAQRSMNSTEQYLAGTNFKHRVEIPRAAIQSFAARRFDEGHDVLLLGHFHEPHTWEHAGGEIRLLDAWFRSRSIEWPAGKPR